MKQVKTVYPIKKNKLHHYTPHKSPMLLIDEVIQCDLNANTLISRLTIHAASLFFDPKEGLVPSWVAFEYIAQSIAALEGIRQVEAGGLPSIGFIMAVRDFKVLNQGFAMGDIVEIWIDQVFRDGNVSTFNGQVLVRKELVCSGVINAFAPGLAAITALQGVHHEN
jgi:predicted hotdog family 3-hydroxylacyl-ACP dehydratase